GSRGVRRTRRCLRLAQPDSRPPGRAVPAVLWGSRRLHRDHADHRRTRPAGRAPPGGAAVTSSVLYDVPGPRGRRRIVVWSAAATVVVVGLARVVICQLHTKGQFPPEKWEPFAEPGIQRGILRALAATVRAATFAIILALIWGALLCLGRLSERPWLRSPAGLVIEFFRAVPLVLLILFVFFGFTDWFDN